MNKNGQYFVLNERATNNHIVLFKNNLQIIFFVCHCHPSLNIYMQSSGSVGGTSGKSEGRVIYYSVVEDDVKIEEGREEPSFHFKGHGLEELTAKLEEETGLEDVIVCVRNRWNGKLYPLRLDLPPNNATMHIVVVPSSSKG